MPENLLRTERYKRDTIMELRYDGRTLKYHALLTSTIPSLSAVLLYGPSSGIDMEITWGE